MAEFRTSSLADQVFEKLENDIVQGVYPRGEIITELKLAEQLGVSRTPIREALRRLEQEHLIEDTGKGSLVLGITEENLIDIMDIRIHIEPMASYYATVNRTDKGLAELSHILDLQDFYCSRHDVEFLRREDEDFHDAIRPESTERFLKMIMKDSRSPFRSIRKFLRQFPLATLSWQQS